MCEDAAPTGHSFEEWVGGALLLSSPVTLSRIGWVVKSPCTGASCSRPPALLMTLTVACAHGASLCAAWTTQVSARTRGVCFGTGRAAHVFGVVAGLVAWLSTSGCTLAGGSPSGRTRAEFWPDEGPRCLGSANVLHGPGVGRPPPLELASPVARSRHWLDPVDVSRHKFIPSVSRPNN